MNNNEGPKLEDNFIGFFKNIFGGISFVFLFICRIVFLVVKRILLGLIFPIILIVRLFGNLYVKYLSKRKEQQLKKDEIKHQKEVEKLEKAKAKREAEAQKKAEQAALEPAKVDEPQPEVVVEPEPELTRISEAMSTDAIEVKTPEELAQQAELEATKQAELEAIKASNEEESKKKEAEKTKEAKIREEKMKSDPLFYKSEEFLANENRTFGDKISDAIENFINIPKESIKKIKKNITDSQLAKQAKKERDLNRQAMLIDINGDDAKKEEKKVMWEYTGKTAEGKTVKGYFAAYSKLEVHSFLLSEGMTVYSIRTNKWIQSMYSSVNGNGCKLKTKDLIFFLTQLSTYIKAGIPLVDALNILTKQFKNKNYKRMFRSMMYDLTMGDSFSKAMENQGNSFPPILINMVKSSELTGELPEALDDMVNYFTEKENAHKEMVSALTYPTVVFFFAFVVLIFIMVYVVPQFSEIYTTMGDVPAMTQTIINVSEWLKSHLFLLIVEVIAFILFLILLYKKIKILRMLMQWIAMHIPVLGKIIIYNEVTMFSKTFASLLSHNVFITDSMDILNKLTNNEIFKLMIYDTIANLASGEKISEAFKDHWAFPIPAYEMIVTGEKTGQLAEMMGKVSTYYQAEHKNMVARVKSLMEPLIIVFLTVVVGIIVLAIVVPMFSMYSSIQNY